MEKIKTNPKICGARNRVDKSLCKALPLTNGRCRLHGGLSTGPKSKKGKAIVSKNAIKDGFFRKETVELLREIRKDLKAENGFLRDLEKASIYEESV